MPQLKADRKDRTDELKDYFYGNCKTTAEVLDFAGGIQFVMAGYSDFLYFKTEGSMSEHLLQEYMLPMKKDKEGETVLDTDKLEERMSEFVDYAIQMQAELTREYKKQLGLIDKNDKDRVRKALLKTRVSEAFYKYKNCVTSALNLCAESEMLNGIPYDYKKKYKELLDSKNEKYLETLSKDEKTYYKAALVASRDEPKFWEKIEPGKVGLDPEEPEKEREKTELKLLERVDFNWASDETMNASPKYLSEQLSSDKNKRYGRYYMSLDNEEDRMKFILNGMLEKGSLEIYQEGKDPISVDCLSKREKQLFRRACNAYFSPVKANGSPDEELFMKRVDAISNEIASLYKKHHEFINDEDNFKGIFKNPTDLNARKKAAEYISPYYKKLAVYKNEMDEIFGSKKIDKSLKVYYILQKSQGETGKLDDKDVDSKIREVFSEVTEDAMRGDLLDDKLGTGSIVNGSEAAFSDEVRKAINQASNSATVSIMKEHINNKPWLNTGKDINMDSLKRMNNLYKQFKNEDRIIYINSKEYTELKKKLKVAADMYKEVSKRKKPEMSSVEKVKMESAFDAIHDAALKYIDGKEKKARGTDHGQNRYEIAFAAMGIAYKGTANRKIGVTVQQPRKNHIK